MDLAPFSVNWDYRCPFARNAHEHVIAALRDGAPWEVTFVPFSLGQTHVAEGDPPVWDDPEKRADLVAVQAGLVVRDRFPEHFLNVHERLFAARHDQAQDLRELDVVREVLREAGAPADEVLKEIDAGWPLERFRAEHETSVTDYGAFGVPTFMTGNRAAFVRLMNRPNGDGQLGRETVERVVQLVAGRPELNELKHTTLER